MPRGHSRELTAVTILDKANMDSIKLNKLKAEVAELMSLFKQVKVPKRIINELNTETLRGDWDGWLQIIPKLEYTAKELLKLGYDKHDLKESARVRQVRFFKTGNIKEQIDTLIPDADLTELSKNLQSIYKKLSNYKPKLSKLYADDKSLYMDSCGLAHEHGDSAMERFEGFYFRTKLRNNPGYILFEPIGKNATWELFYFNDKGVASQILFDKIDKLLPLFPQKSDELINALPHLKEIKELTGHTHISKIQKDHELIKDLLSKADIGTEVEYKSIHDVLGNMMEERGKALKNLDRLVGEISQASVIVKQFNA